MYDSCLPRRTLQNIMLAAVLITTAGVTLAFSENLLRGYVVARFCFLLTGASVFLATLCAAWLAKDPLMDQNRRFFIILAAQGVALGVSVLVSIMPWVSLLGSVPRMMGALTYWCYLLGAAATVVAIGHKRNRIVVVLRLLMVLSVVVAIHSFYELPSVRGFRPPGLLGNPDFLGNWLVVVFASGFALLLVEKSKPATITAGAGTVFALTALVYSQTRGAWLGLAVSVFVFIGLARPREEQYQKIRSRVLIWAVCTAALVTVLLVAYKIWGLDAVREFVKKTPRQRLSFNLELFRRRTYTAAILVTLVAVVLVIWSQAITRWKQLGRTWHIRILVGCIALVAATTGIIFGTKPGQTFAEKNLRLKFKNEGRTIIWRDTIKGMVPEVWHKGCGIETFRVAFLPHKSIDLAKNGPKQNWRNPHNVILYELTSNGILGLLTYLAVVIFSFLALVRARRQSLQTSFGLLVTGLLASFCGYLVHNLFNYDVVATGYTFYLMVGLAQASWLVSRYETKAAETKPRDGAKEKDPSTPVSKKTYKRKKHKKKSSAAKKKSSKEGKKTPPVASPISLPLTARIVLLACVGVVMAGTAARSTEQTGWVIFLFTAAPLLFWGALELRSTAWHGVKQKYVVFSQSDALPPGVTLTLAISYAVLFVTLAGAYFSFDWLYQTLAKDALPVLLLVVVESCWMIMAFAPSSIWHRTDASATANEAEKDRESAAAPTDGKTKGLCGARLWSGAVITAAVVSGAVWFCAKQVRADWGLHKAKGYSKVVDRKLNRRLNKLTQARKKIKQRLRRAERQNVSAKMLAAARRRLRLIEHNLKGIKLQFAAMLKKILHYGRMGTNHFRFMGFFHHQYSKSLQPFVRNPGRLSKQKANAVMMEAVRHAQMAPRNNTNPESAYSHLAVMHYWSMRFCSVASGGSSVAACKKRRFQKAKSALRKSIGHDRFYYDTHRMMAFMQMKDGNLDAAVREIKLSKKIIRNKLRKFSNVKQVDDMIKRALLRKGYRLSKKKEYADAVLAYEDALNLYGEPMPEAHHLLGSAYMNLKRYKEAERHLRLAIKQNSRLYEAHLDMARLHFKRQQVEKGFERINKLIVPRVRDADALLVRAWAYEKLGKIQAARKDLKRYLILEPRSKKAARVRKKLAQLK